MYERMLDKSQLPTHEELSDYCGDCKHLFKTIDDFLVHQLNLQQLIRFPYGNSYGWGIKYFIKSKHICDLFPEKNAFTIMLRLSNSEFAKHYNELSPKTQNLIDSKYPCSGGGWIHYRILTENDLKDIKTLLQIKTKKI